MTVLASKQSGTTEKKHVCGRSIDVDWMVDFGKAAGVFAEKGIAICGNADPVSVFFQGTPEEVYRATCACLEAGQERCFIAAGCEIPDGTPQENLRAQNRALKA